MKQSKKMCYCEKASRCLDNGQHTTIVKPIFRFYVPDTLVLSRINEASLTTLALWEFARGNLDRLDVAEV